MESIDTVVIDDPVGSGDRLRKGLVVEVSPSTRAAEDVPVTADGGNDTVVVVVLYHVAHFTGLVLCEGIFNMVRMARSISP